MSTANGERLFIGFDVGSSAVHSVVLNEHKEIIYSPKPKTHFANPLGTLKESWNDIASLFTNQNLSCTTFTGSVARTFKDALPDIPYLADSIAIPDGASLLAPSADTIIHIGAKDSHYFRIKNMEGVRTVQDYRTSTKCGASSGTQIEKQYRRLYEDVTSQVTCSSRAAIQSKLESIFCRGEQEAKRSHNPSRLLSRCGVIAQTDMIHYQNEGAPREDILAGLLRMTARTFVVDVLGARTIDQGSTVISTGGVFGSDIIGDILRELIGVINITRPQHYLNIAAIGAALNSIEADHIFSFDPSQLINMVERTRQNRAFAPPLSSSLPHVINKKSSLKKAVPPETEVVIGIDGGSTTTKAVLVEVTTKELLDKIYISTRGNPVDALKKVLKYLRDKHHGNVKVVGVGATGSARDLYARLLISQKLSAELKSRGKHVTDLITDEVTCHALGARHYEPGVDTILEIGGQDMKFTRFSDDGTVKEARMNYSCQAGSGQTLENMANLLGLSVETNLQEYALRAKRVPIIDSTCGVFMETDLNRLIAEGLSKEEMAAAIIRATAQSYLSKFVGGKQHIGVVISSQGGPPLGSAFLAALAQVTEKSINAFPHREVFGAWGQALDIIYRIQRYREQGKDYGSAFRGWDIVDMPLERQEIHCKELLRKESCGTRDCKLDVFDFAGEKVVSGGFCPKGCSESTTQQKRNYVQVYHQYFDDHFSRYGSLLGSRRPDSVGRGTIGIRRATTTLGTKGIWSAALLHSLGFHPIATPQTTRDIAQRGIDKSRTEYCFARKIVTGHAELLARDEAIDYFFDPTFIKHSQHNSLDHKYCVYTEAESFILRDIFRIPLNKQISPVIHFNDDVHLARNIRSEFKRLGFDISGNQIRKALEYAYRAERAFKEELYREGDIFLKQVSQSGRSGYIGIGRDYILLDPEASSHAGNLFVSARRLGLDYIPQIFIAHKYEDITFEGMHSEYWIEMIDILKADIFVAQQSNLYPIRMLNFGCGPDTVKIYHEEEIYRRSGKPVLKLVTDAHTCGAGFKTRAEAFKRVVDDLNNVY